jgi:hypothetical protein
MFTRQPEKGRRTRGGSTFSEGRTWKPGCWFFLPAMFIRMHSHPSDCTYYVITGRGIMKGPDETHELSPGKILSIRRKISPRQAGCAPRSIQLQGRGSSISMAAAGTKED